MTHQQIFSPFVDGDHSLVRCPNCASEAPDDRDHGFLVHLGRVAVNQGRQLVEMTEGRTEISSVADQHRGSLVSVDFWCENGHRFSTTLQFHKGSTAWGLRIHQPFEAGNHPQEMWRD